MIKFNNKYVVLRYFSSNDDISFTNNINGIKYFLLAIDEIFFIFYENYYSLSHFLIMINLLNTKLLLISIFIKLKYKKLFKKK
jgi:hypothetical protein